MRYTTIIDISEFPLIYKNVNARLLYLHLCLKAGYHDDDRDVCEISIRRMAIETSLTLSAVRHALKVLEKAKLIERFGPSWKIKKFVLLKEITPRVKSEKKRQELEVKAEEEARRAEEKRRDDENRARVKELRKQGKSPFMAYVEGLKAKAEQGDMEALELFRKHSKVYYEQLEFFKNPENRK